MESANRVHIFDYLDYRAFLRDFYKQQKAEGRSFSFRAFARRAQIRSFNFLPLVMKGERDLSSAMAVRFAKGCGLDGNETAYFCDLVAFGQALNAEERNRAYERLRRFRSFREAQKLEPAQAAYHSSWYVPAIRELVAVPGFREDAKWIAATLRPAISAAQAKQALATLIDLGLLVRDADGNLVQSVECVTTGGGPLGHHVVNYHRAMMNRAICALDEFPREQRDISSVTLTVSAEGFAELKERIAAFRKELMQRADASGPADHVVQLNVQLFPLSKTLKGQP
ncbi:MAG: TIGR02147 family protein [Polyangiaceae bacterium]